MSKSNKDLKSMLGVKSYASLYLFSSALFWVSAVLCQTNIIFIIIAFILFIVSFMSLFDAIFKEKKFAKPILVLILNLFVLFFIFPIFILNNEDQEVAIQNDTVQPVQMEIPVETVQDVASEEVVANIGTNTEIEIETQTQQALPQITLEELKAQCVEYKYKDVLRNPENYIGQYVHVRVRISSVHDASWLNARKYYFAYTKDEYGWYGDRYGIYDCRESGSQKILTDDVIDVWGVIENPEETTSLIVNSEELFVIDMLYSELIAE